MTGQIRQGQTVRTADGTLCQVNYVAGDHAELWPIDENTWTMGSTLRLPLSELRRVPDPRKAKPPIEGMPAARPRCAWCDRPLKPVIHEERVGGAYSGRVVRRVFKRWSSYEGVFDTMGCGVKFGGASYRGGYRRKR